MAENIGEEKPEEKEKKESYSEPSILDDEDLEDASGGNICINGSANLDNA